MSSYNVYRGGNWRIVPWIVRLVDHGDKDNVDYFRNKIISALKIPRDYIFDESVGFRPVRAFKRGR